VIRQSVDVCERARHQLPDDVDDVAAAARLLPVDGAIIGIGCAPRRREL